MAYLLLEDGTVWEGTLFGAAVKACGEIVFNTSMEGYQEILTDPANRGKIVTMTYPMIGNYGVNGTDFESDGVQAAGLVVHEECGAPSNFLSEGSLDEYMKKHGIVGISGIDTRALTRKIRENGTLKAVISEKKPAKGFSFDKIAPSSVSEVSTKATYSISGSGKKIAVIDCGVKKSMLDNLSALNAALTVFPWNVSAEAVLNGGFDGVFVSSGPFCREDCECVSETLKALLGKLPIFGVGFGCQALTLAIGGKLARLPHGHRGANQPVKNLKTGKMLVTTQNHGYTISEKSLPEDAEVTYRNWNDRSVEGIALPGKQAFGVLFYPEKCTTVHDTSYLYGELLQAKG